MKKIILTIVVIGIGTTVNAQWTESGSNLTTTDNVGIGISTPNEKFHVKNGNVKFEFDSQFGNDPMVIFENDGTNANVRQSFYRWSGNSDLYWGTRFEREASTGFSVQMASTSELGSHSFIDALTISNNGSVGIGTTLPSFAILQIRGGESHQLFAVNRPDSDVPALYLGNDGTLNAVIAANNSDLIFGRDISGSFNEYMRIQNGSGEVAIGTSDFSGDHKLRVEGSIGAREIKVEASDWSDFVFENDYELRTLEEVEQHINANGHLPEIPSEAEVSENGINLGEMDAKLLQKIEELTLYLIEQNKQNKESQMRIERLEKLNSELLDKLENN